MVASLSNNVTKPKILVMDEKRLDKETLKRYLALGLTQREIAEKWSVEGGRTISRSAVAMAIARYDLQDVNPHKKNADLIPWVVRSEHQMALDARRLRALGKRNRGEKVPKVESKGLDNWLAELDRMNAAIYYNPDTVEGFFWVERGPDGRIVRETLEDEQPA